MDKKTYVLPTRDTPHNKRPTQTESEGLEKNIPGKWARKKKAGVAVLISDKIDFKTKAIKRDPEAQTLCNTQGKNPSRRHKLINIHVPNIGAPKFIRKFLEDFKKDIDSNTLTVGNFNTPLSKMDRSSKQNISKDIVALKNILDQMDLTDLYRAFHPKEAKYTFFSNTHGTFSKLDHMIGHKTSLNKFKKIEIIYQAFLGPQGPEIRNQPQGKSSKTLKFMEI